MESGTSLRHGAFTRWYPLAGLNNCRADQKHASEMGLHPKPECRFDNWVIQKGLFRLESALLLIAQSDTDLFHARLFESDAMNHVIDRAIMRHRKLYKAFSRDFLQYTSLPSFCILNLPSSCD